MSWLQIITLYIGVIIFASFMYFCVYGLVDVMVTNPKNKTKKLIPTNNSDEKEIVYNVSPRLKNLHKNLNNNKIFAKIGFIIGGDFASLPLMQIIVSMMPQI